MTNVSRLRTEFDVVVTDVRVLRVCEVSTLTGYSSRSSPGSDTVSRAIDGAELDLSTDEV